MQKCEIETYAYAPASNCQNNILQIIVPRSYQSLIHLQGKEIELKLMNSQKLGSEKTNQYFLASERY